MTTRKGILLAGGSGTRLYPLNRAVSKQLVPVYDKPMIYYPLTTLMLGGIREILVITTPADHERFRELLGDGTQWGLHLDYAVQPSPDGIAQAMLIGESFAANERCALILGDNLFYGHGLQPLLVRTAGRADGAVVFAYRVSNPEAYGVVDFDSTGRVVGLEEKPATPRSHFVATGLYFYDRDAADLVRSLTPSSRGELEITDLNRLYLDAGRLHVEVMGRGFAWLDTGTPDALLHAANFIETVQTRQGQHIACPEEIALRKGWIDRDQVRALAAPIAHTAYGKYLLGVADDDLTM